MLRIGELSRRVGVSDHLLRAWESRYGLLRPERSTGGFRLYSEADERRVRRMQTHLGDGMSAAQAARRALEEEPSAAATVDAERGAAAGAPMPVARLRAILRRALDEFDEPGAQAVIDRLLADFTVPAALRDVVLPYLGDLGDRWERGEVSVAQEHFASNVVRGRLAGLSRGWGAGRGPRAVLACPPGELHDLALLSFGIVLHASGWRISFLGAATPLENLRRTVDVVRPDLVVLAGTMRGSLEPLRDELTQLARQAPLAIGGAAATAQLAEQIGARLLAADPITEAQQVA